jgi:HEAT repeat protein
MPKAPSIEDRLAELEGFGQSLDDPGTIARIRERLADKASVVVAKAAKLAARVPAHDFGPELVAAFHRLLIDPVKTDKGCVAKTAIVEALLGADLDDDDDVFRIGVRHVQLEPAMGGKIDTAARLRALCALGLVQLGAPDVLDELAVLLADPEGDARLGAVRALAACGSAATPLLRLKALTGDEQPLVLAECLGALMSIDAGASFDFAARHVAVGDPLAPHAAMALGESRHPGAFELLEQRWREAFDDEFRQSLLLPVALTRDDRAPGLLIEALEAGELAAASAALSALSIYRGDPEVRARAEAALRGPHRARLATLFRRVFD